MAAQRRPYSHVAIIHEGKIIHAVGEGVCVEDANEYLVERTVVFQRDVELYCSPDRFWGFVEGECGKEYSSWQLVAIALGVPWFANADEKRICSEFVANIVQRFGTELLSWPSLDHVTPRCLEIALNPTRPE